MWVIECQQCSGNECVRKMLSVNTRDEAIDKVLGELEWRCHPKGPKGLRFVMQENEECYEDQATGELLNGQFDYTTETNCHISYRLREQ